MTAPTTPTFMVVQAMVVEGEERRPTLFLVATTRPRPDASDPNTCTLSPTATRSSRSRTFASRTPARLVAIGRGGRLANEWFVTERIHIALAAPGR